MNEVRVQNVVETTQIERSARPAPDLDIRTLASGDVVFLRTRNSEYRLRLVDPAAARTVIEGGSIFKEPATVEIIGACEGLGVPLEAGQIRIGTGLLLLHCGSWVRMSKVRSVVVEHPAPPRH